MIINHKYFDEYLESTNGTPDKLVQNYQLTMDDGTIHSVSADLFNSVNAGDDVDIAVTITRTAQVSLAEPAKVGV